MTRPVRAVAALVVLLLAAPLAGCAGGAAASRPAREPVPAAELPALRVLHRWDAARARAWAAGSPDALRDLYLPGAEAGRVDVRLLGEYVDRGLRVRGLRVQVLAADVLAAGPRRLRLRVTDRLAGGVAVGAHTRTPLPRDAASTRVLTLVRDGAGEWRMAAVVSAPARP